MTVPTQFVFGCGVALLMGLCIGSFLNVVIWRLPRNGSLTEPQWSYCPNCSHRLGFSDLVPLLSYILRGRRCKYCGKPISSRYFWVELITGVLFVVLYFHFRADVANAVAILMFAAVLVPIYCIDLESFEIPVSLNLLAFVIAVGRDVYGIAMHEPGHAPIWHWLPVSLVGALAGIAVFGTVRVLGWIWKRQEAMGLGDVLLARAMGAMLVSVVPVGANPLRLVPIWVLLSCGSGAVIGIWLIRARSAQESKLGLSVGPGDDPTEEDEDQVDDSSLKQELRDIGYVLWLEDVYEYIRYVFTKTDAETPQIEEDDWTPAPTAVPFGPFMVAGFIITLLVGEPLTAMYLAYAIPTMPQVPKAISSPIQP